MIYLTLEFHQSSHRQQQESIKAALLAENITPKRQRNWDRRSISRDLDPHYTPVISGKAPQIPMTQTLLDLLFPGPARLLPLLI